MLAAAAVAAVFVVTSAPYLALPPGIDGWKNLGLVENVPAATYFTDPLVSGYVFQFYFEPVWTLLFNVDVALEPHLGAWAWHVVNIVAALAIAAQIARLGGGAGGLVAAVFFLASSPVWFTVGMATARNYLCAVAFALAALRPFWRAHERGSGVSPGAALLSGLFFALAVGCKEAVAALPALFLALDWHGRRRLAGSVAAVLPHAVALALLLGWRWHLLGGPGGYWMQTTISPGNLILVFPLLAELLWGSLWPAGIVAVAAAVWHQRRTGARVAAACLAGVLPFVLIGNFAPPELGPIAAARLLLPWALVALLLGRAIAAVAAERAAIAAVLLLVLLGAQAWQRPVVVAGLTAAVPLDPVADAAANAEVPTVAVTSASMAAAFEHQLRAEPKPALAVYQSPTSYLLDRALGWQPPAGAARLRVDESWRIPSVDPLDLGESEVWAEPGGHFRARLRLPPGAANDLFLTWIHENGSTRWVVTLPVGRDDITLPLSYSIRRIVLSRFATGSDRWQAWVWESPFFRPQYP
jgi:hypothetical protein